MSLWPPSRHAIAGVRTLPLRFAPVAGEGLDSWLEAVARGYDIPLGDLVSSCGIARTRPTAASWLSLTCDEVCRLSHAAGVEPEAIRAMTVEHYGVDVLRGDEVRHHLDRALWVRHASSRFCPDCLRESDGRWQLSWRLNWHFVCVKHRCLLADLCAVCDGAQRTRPPRARRVPESGIRCRTGAPPSPACAADLTGTDVLRLREEHPLLDAQRIVDDLLDERSPHLSVYGGNPPGRDRILGDIKTLSQWIFASVGQTEIDRHLPADIGTAVEAHRRTAAWPHGAAWWTARATPSSLDTAAGITIALEVLALDEFSSAAAILAQLMGSANSSGPYRAAISHGPALTSAVGAIHRAAHVVTRAEQKKLMSRRFYRGTAASPSGIAT